MRSGSLPAGNCWMRPGWRDALPPKSPALQAPAVPRPCCAAGRPQQSVQASCAAPPHLAASPEHSPAKPALTPNTTLKRPAKEARQPSAALHRPAARLGIMQLVQPSTEHP